MTKNEAKLLFPNNLIYFNHRKNTEITRVHETEYIGYCCTQVNDWVNEWKNEWMGVFDNSLIVKCSQIIFVTLNNKFTKWNIDWQADRKTDIVNDKQQDWVFHI